MDNLAEIFEKCKQNDRQAQYQLFKTQGPSMLAICRRYVSNTDDARDAMQEGFVKLFSSLSKFRGESNPKTWMTRIFINTAIDHFKKNYKETEVFKSYFQELPAISLLTENEDQDFPCTPQQILEILDEIPPGYKTVFNLYCIDSFTHAQIAQTLNISEGTSKSQYARAKKHILQELIKKGVIHGKAC